MMVYLLLDVVLLNVASQTTTCIVIMRLGKVDTPLLMLLVHHVQIVVLECVQINCVVVTKSASIMVH